MTSIPLLVDLFASQARTLTFHGDIVVFRFRRLSNSIKFVEIPPLRRFVRRNSSARNRQLFTPIIRDYFNSSFIKFPFRLIAH